MDQFIEKFTSKIQFTDECWLWKGTLDKDGYGIYSGKKAHRIAFQLANGFEAPDMVLHSCIGCRNCVNPEHLRNGTQTDNMLDAKEQNRIRKGTKHRDVKLTEELVIEIYKSNELNISLAKKFNVAPCTISQIKNGHKWQWLTSTL